MGPLFRLAFVSLSVGLADSLSPETVGPALYLATGARRAWAVTQFTAGVFAVNLVVGGVVTTGLGRWALRLVPHPQHTVRHVIELVAGALLLLCAAALWVARRRLARRALPMPERGGSALLTGASIAALGIPTAIPYFAVIAAITASTATLPQQVVLVLIYNVAFVAPLLAIIALLLVAGQRAVGPLEAMGRWLQRQWPVILAILLLVVGGILVIVGGAGLVR